MTGYSCPESQCPKAAPPAGTGDTMSARGLLGVSLVVAILAMTIPDSLWVRPSFLALSVVIGLSATRFAIREENRLAGSFSAIATTLITVLLVHGRWESVIITVSASVAVAGAVGLMLFLPLVRLRKERPPPPISAKVTTTGPPLPLLPFAFHAAPEALKERFAGREREFAELDAAWAGILSGEGADPNHPPIRVMGIVAWGGFGKSALARQWLWWRFEGGTRDGNNKSDNNPIALFWWSFRKGQGLDNFVLALIRYLSGNPGLGLADIPPGAAGRLATLREALDERDHVLVLDGLEVEQHSARGDGLGRLKSPFLRELLREQAAGRLGRGLVIVASRLNLADLDRRDGGYLAMDLEDRPLSNAEACLLLTGEGVTELSDRKLAQLMATIGPHPLALVIMAGILVRHNQGSAAGWRRFQEDVPEPPQGREQERKLRQVLAWSARVLQPDEARLATAIARFREPVEEEWLLHLLAPAQAPVVTQETLEARWQRRLEQAGQNPAQVEAVLKLFREQSEAERAKTEAKLEELLGKLGAAPIYPPEELQLPGDELTGRRLRDALDGLTGLRLLRREAGGHYAMHDSVREYFCRADDAADAGNAVAAHCSLYRLYSSVIQPVWRPDELEGLHPLYETLWHGARTGQYQEILDDVYRDRVLRGTGSDGFYSTRKLGAMDADLEAVANLFVEPWTRPVPGLAPGDQAWLLNEAAMRLRALGRIEEAVTPLGIGLEMRIEQENWNSAARIASNLSELEITLGRVVAAIANAERSVQFANRIGADDWQNVIVSRTALADALHQAGRREEALRLFAEAEAIQKEFRPESPRLYSVQGFQYADLSLAGAERGAWLGWISVCGLHSSGVHLPPALAPTDAAPADVGSVDAALQPYLPYLACDNVTARATETLAWMTNDPNAPILDIALDRLTLARAGLYRALLAPISPAGAQVKHLAGTSPLLAIEAHLAAAADGLRKSGYMDYLLRALLTQAWFLAFTGDGAGTRTALEEARGIAETGPMPLFEIDVLLTRARLFGMGNGKPGRKNGAGDSDSEYPQGSVKEDLEEARTLMEKHGYHRRDEELADTEAMLEINARTPRRKG
uniref:Tetratricopeptide repeat-containing protein n=1 Tax=Candidatus Kentrum sp. FM TaxID=2126340 RepID=A0A450T835_9GAMM|nr:MAG: Tetratricopeptide repeat-containing protein [Candidatus Kentron sp. FM]VFJ62884.1 MAG: Tetratricopeptide repeat-containing protein [Candidatus Kentron sp. FM]VFK14142.1 MAG: Tetratricopeptide repeat-containing protein [Candidatus Kentron sp. FM]